MSTAVATSTSLHPRVRRLCHSINTQQVWRARGRGRGRAARGIRLCSAPSHSQRPTDLSDAISIARAPPAARRLHCARLGCLLRPFPVVACRVVCRQPRRRPARPGQYTSAAVPRARQLSLTTWVLPAILPSRRARRRRRNHHHRRALIKYYTQEYGWAHRAYYKCVYLNK